MYKTLIFIILSLSLNVNAQQNQPIPTDTLPPSVFPSIALPVSPPREGSGEATGLEEVIISASRTAEPKQDISQQVRVIGKTEIQNINASTTAELLQTTGVVAVQKSQLGGGSPVLRGFEANRVLLVVDGVRQNNLIFRSGHLQNIISLDANATERIEILYGNGATMYGSDALGGVISLFTQKPNFTNKSNQQTVQTSGFFRYGTAANETTLNANINIANQRFASRTIITASAFGNLRKGANNLFADKNNKYTDFGNCTQYVVRGSTVLDTVIQNADPNLQYGTKYSQLDVLQRFSFLKNTYSSHTHHLNFQFSTSTDVPRYDRLQQFSNGKPRFAEWYYGPQRRFMGAYNYENIRGRYWDKLNTIIAFQNIEESRHSRLFLDKNIQRQFENVQILSFNVDAVKELAPSDTKLYYGAETFLQQNKSTAYSNDIIIGTPTKTTIGARYPNARMNTAAIYANILGKIEIPRTNNSISQRIGVRLTANSLTANFNDFALNADAKYTAANQQNLSIDWHYGILCLINDHFSIATNALSAFKTPNVDDLGKTFEQTNGTIILPNPSLQPEKMIQGDLTFEYKNNSTTATITGFLSRLNNGITVKPTPFNGQDSVTYNGLRYLALANVNIAESSRSGASLHLKTLIFKSLSANASLTYTYGYDTTNNTPLDHIPPVFGIVGVQYQKRHWSAEAFTLFNGWKHTWEYSPTGEDNPDKATADGTYAWYTLNLRGHYTFNRHFKLQLTAENLLDANYRTFASGLNGAGRNIVTTLRCTF